MNAAVAYESFLDRKTSLDSSDGFAPITLPNFLFDYQHALVDYAIRKGRSAIFADCGLGKTPMQLVWADNVVRATNKPVLILTPLAVAGQTCQEAEKFGIETSRPRDGKPVDGINVTNYERLHHFDPNDFSGMVCDESSILKSFDGARKQEITAFMRKMRYRLLCTATAAPNDYIELGTSSEALGYLGHMDMLNRFFKNDMNNSATGRAYWKEPLGVRNRTMAKNLAHKTIVEDSSRCSVASADWLLVFRKTGKNPVPIEHPVGLLEYAGERQMPEELLPFKGWTGKQTENRYSHWIWRQYASAFWDDIRLNRVLPFKSAREEDDEKHVHPLQLDVIDRILVLWSNPGETVLTPFMGVGSEVYGAIVAGRRGIGVELKESYYRQAVMNCEAAIAGGIAAVSNAKPEPEQMDWVAQLEAANASA